MSGDLYLSVAGVVLTGGAILAFLWFLARGISGDFDDDFGWRDDDVARFVDACREVCPARASVCGYRFAHALSVRFDGDVVRVGATGRFAARVGSRYYDVRGDVTDEVVSSGPVATLDDLDGPRALVEWATRENCETE